MKSEDGKNYKYVDHLDEDDPIQGQGYVCMSFLSPEGIKNCSLRGLKIRGVYSTEDEANARCAELQKIDPNFHVFVGEVGKWLPWDPDPTSQTDQVYRETELNDLMIKYKENLQKAKETEKQRKSDLLTQAISDEKARRKLEKEQEQKKIRSKDNKKKFISNAMSSLNKDSKYANLPRSARKHNHVSQLKTEAKKNKDMAEKEGERLRELNKNIQEKENDLKQVDENISKIKKLYAKLKEKENATEEDKGQSQNVDLN